MTNALLSMQYPEWLLVIGAALVLLGFIGLALFGTKASETELDEEMMFSEGNHEPQTPIELALAQEQDRKAKLSRQAKARWDDEDDNSADSEWSDRPRVTGTRPN
jgi:hypothetical protein